MKKVLPLSALALSIALLAASMSGCGDSGGTRVQPTSTPAATPNPSPTTSSSTTHPFAFLRTTSVDPAPMSQRQIQAARRAAKLDYATNRQAAITVVPHPVDLYVWPIVDEGIGWWPRTERKITGTPGAYTSVHLSFNGRNIVYSAIVNGYNQLFAATVPAEGSMMGQPLQLTSDAQHHWLPHISADGSKVVFTKLDPTSNGDMVCIIDNLAGATEKCLDLSSTTPVLKGSNIWHASWLSNNQIVFEAWGGPLSSDEIFTISSDGNGLIQVTNNGATNNYDECPSANADGTWISVDTWKDTSQHYEITHINVSTKERQIVAGDGWDPLPTYFTTVWVSQLDTDHSPQIYMDAAFDNLRLSNNAYANYFDSSLLTK